MRKISLKNKIILWFSVIIIIISFFVLYAMTGISQSIIMREIENNLINSVNDLSFKFNTFEATSIVIPEHSLYSEGVQMAVYDTNGDVALGFSPFGIETKISFEDEYLQKVTIQNKDYYVYDKKVGIWNDYYIRGVVCITNETEVLQIMVKYNIITIIIMICIAILGGFVILNSAFMPINNMTNTAREISESNDLTQRITEYDSNDEIHYLIKMFNRMLDRVEEAFKKEKQFTSDASHELRTPITVILSECEYGEECVEKFDNAEELKEILFSIKLQANKMSKLVSELLLISRMDSNRLKLNFEETNLSELLTFVCEEQVEIQSKDIKLNQEIQSDIFGNVDRSLITRLFINLISNAYQYSDKGTTIVVSLYLQEENIVFSVKDEGIGIAENDIEKIWDRFYQVDSSRASEGNSSSGLGLSMVKWISDCHKGELFVNSKLGEGSEFIFKMKSSFMSDMKEGK